MGRFAQKSFICLMAEFHMLLEDKACLTMTQMWRLNSNIFSYLQPERKEVSLLKVTISAFCLCFNKQRSMIMIVRWMTVTVTTAVKQATGLHGTTTPPRQIRQCTSTQWDAGSSTK